MSSQFNQCYLILLFPYASTLYIRALTSVNHSFCTLATNIVASFSYALSHPSSIVRPPMITSQPAPQEFIIPGRSAIFNVTTTGDKLSYQWQKNGTNIPGPNLPTLTIQSVAERDEGQYICVVCNDAGSVTSTPANLTVCKYFSSVNAFYYSIGIVIYIYRWLVKNISSD